MKRIIFIALFFTLGVTFVYAQGLSTLSDRVTRHAPSTASDHVFTFTTTAGLGDAGDTLTITFDGAFDLSALTVDDFDLSYGPTTGLENDLTLAGLPDATNWGVSVSGTSFTFEHPTDLSFGDIPASSVIVVKVGLNAVGGSNQIINPATLGSEIIRITTSDGEYGALAIPIAQDQVGVSADTTTTEPTVTIQWAVPELRIGTPETNDDATFYISLLTSDDNDDVVLFTQPTLADLDDDGTYSTPIVLTGQTPGTYDISIKTDQHLSKKLNDVNLVGGNNVLNFSTTDNSAPKGSEVLLAGDVNGDGTNTSNLGDDVVNSIDISTLLVVLDDDDLTGNAIRPNVNQDVVVNSVDLSILIKNLDLEGEQ